MIRDELNARESGRQSPPSKQRKQDGEGEQDADMGTADGSETSRKIHVARRSPTPTPSRAPSSTAASSRMPPPAAGGACGRQFPEDEAGDSTLGIRGFAAERTAAYLDAAATHVMGGLGIKAQYETKSRGCTQAAKIMFTDVEAAQAALKEHGTKRFDFRHDAELRILRDRCASERQRALQANRTVAKCAAMAKEVGYAGLVELSGGKVYAVEDDLVILARISPPWEDFSYSLEGAGMERMGVKSAAVKQAVTELDGKLKLLMR